MLAIENLDTGVITILMNEDPLDCAMCGKEGWWRSAVPWYCGPVMEGQSEGGYKTVCRRCHDRWAAWNDNMQYQGA